jgi:ribulose-bisphosphate carboxylase large chain
MSERFLVEYTIWGTETQAFARAKDICLEQTVELPESLVPKGFIQDFVVGKIEQFYPIEHNILYRATISFAIDTAADELTQLINVAFGNISLKPGIRLERLILPPSLLNSFQGPRFGLEGLRKYLNVSRRPLLCTALKPMGLNAKGLAELAYQFAKGGIDLIKDDHGLSNQVYAPFTERVKLCVEAIARANAETGGNSIYVANITAPSQRLRERALQAKELGAGGMLLAPGLIGLDTMRALAEDNAIALPILSHPSFQGSYVASENGISHFALFGQLARLGGADASIFPNFGGRFSFSKEQCINIRDGCQTDMAHLKKIFPTPGGGMTLERVSQMYELYGKDVIFLMGAGLLTHSPDIIENSKYFRSLIENN